MGVRWWLLLTYLGFWACGLVWASILQECGQCMTTSVNQLSCPNLSNPHRLTLTISDHRKAPESVLTIRCRSESPFLNTSLLMGCNFTSIRYVYFSMCPLLDQPFSEVLEEIGVDVSKVKTLSFENADQRNGLTLRPDHLQGLPALLNLQFDRNNFTKIPPNLLEVTPSLKFFGFTENTLGELPKTLFASTPNLSTLTLRNNGITSLPDNLLAGLPHLVSLSLYDNELSEVQPQLLEKASRLSVLVLAYNKITHLPSSIFAHLINLTRLDMAYNNIRELPGDLLDNCPNLTKLVITQNQLTTLPAALFKKNKKLTDLNLSKNQITSIPGVLFSGLQNLINLNLQFNNLISLPVDVFFDLVNLEALDLRANQIQALPPNSFVNQRKLNTLILLNNSLSELPNHIFKDCESLEKLYLHHNNLTSLLASSFPHPKTVLRILYLSNNNLSFSTHSDHLVLQEHFPLSSQTSLYDLRLNDNQISSMPSALTVLFPNLAHLNLSSNNIDYIDQSDLSFISANIKVLLQNNTIKTVALADPEGTQSGKKVELRLSGNPLACDCHLFHLAKLMQKQALTPSTSILSWQLPNPIPATGDDSIIVEDAKDVTCIQEDGNNEVKVLDVDASALTCPSLVCVAPCTCSTRPSDHMFIFDCSNRGLQKPPQFARFSPQEITANTSLAISNLPNNITTLQLSVTDNPVSYLQPTTTTMPARYLQEYKTLVNLTNNDIAFVNESFFPASLKILDMRGNRLTTLPESFLGFLNKTNATLSLGRNPWVCDCTLLPLFAFLRDPARNVTDAPKVVCRNLEMPLVKMLEENLCPLIQQPMVIVTIASTTVFLCLFFILGTVSVYRYQQDIKVWLFTHRLCLWAVAEEEQDANKKYDAFISYSNKDEEFVNSVLVPGLESGDPKYRVCLHYRDWTPGGYIQTQIDQSIEASRRTIVVLSNNFIENVWGQIEFKTAHSKALKDKTNRIIVIVFGEIPPESQMDEEMKLYLSTRTYLQWRDPKFWEKLRYAMPHPQQFVHRKHRPQQKTDKLELQANSTQTV